MLSKIWTSIRDSVLTPARIVPLVGHLINLGVAAGAVALAKYGFDLPPAVIIGMVTPIALGGAASILHWQTGWQQYEDKVVTTAIVQGTAQRVVHKDDPHG